MLKLRDRILDENPALQVNVGLVLRPIGRPELTNRELTALLREGVTPTSCEQARISHNVFVDLGRSWLRSHICASSFPAPVAADVDLGSTYSILPTPLDPSAKTYRIRWMALGIGGQLQRDTPPGVGTFIEDRAVTGLENPYTVSGTTSPIWMKQVLPVSAAVIDFLPDATTARFRCSFSPGEVAYPGSHNFDSSQILGTDVPVSEAGLFTSAANPLAAPLGTSVTPAAGLVAYNIFRTIPITPTYTLEIVWDLRF